MSKRVLLITNSFSGGGAENSMALLHKSFISKGIDSHLICLNQENKKAIEADQSGVVTLNRGWGDGISGTLRNFLSFRRMIRELDADVLVGNCELPELYLSLISLRKFEAYCVEHTSSPWFGRRILGYCVRTVLALKKVSWVTVSREASPVWPSDALPRFIPNPVKPLHDNDLSKSPTKLAFVGRLRAEKRPDWALAVSEISGLAIDFYGDGPMETELKARANISEIDATFHGYTEDVWDLIHSNTIIVAPSEFEGDGLAIVEAILRGLPIVLADNADLRRFELSDDCYSSSPLEMAKKLLDCSESDLNDLRPSRQMIDKYARERSLESISRAWEQFLQLR